MNWRKPIIYLALYASGSKIPQYLREIRRVASLPDEQKKAYQDEKLKKLLLHASKNVPYYARILPECGVVQGDTVDLTKFADIPILTKDTIRREGENMYSKDKNKRKPYENTSGGSTGEPVRFLQDKEYSDWNIANKIFYKEVGGHFMGERELRFWGSERDLLEGNESPKIRLRNWLYNRREFNTFKMSEAQMREYVTKWNEYKPQWVEAYVQSIYEFARFLEANNLTVSAPRGVLTSAGTLYPEMRSTIEKVLGCKVYNRYGSREVGDAAIGIKNTSMMLSIWNQYLEVLNNQFTNIHNGIGKIYITTLNNFSMPMIRYDIGDMGTIEEGRFSNVEGREMSVFKRRDGSFVPAEFFIHFVGVVYNQGFISKFQAIQKDYDLIDLRVVVRDKVKFDKHKNEIENSIILVMGKSCQIKWTEVAEIEPSKSGKYLYTICEI